MDNSKIKQQIKYLFFSNLGILFVGMGLFPILPLYAGEFGASPKVVGVYLALTYVSLSAGTMLTSWLTERFSRRRVFIAAGLVGIPALILLGQASALWQVVILTGAVWFTGGVGVTMANLLTGLLANKEERGKSFGLIAIATPLGAVLGGGAVGALLEWQGYPTMFASMALVWALWPVMAIWKVEYGTDAPQGQTSSGDEQRAGRPGTGFTLLLVSMLLTAFTVSISRLGLSLSMEVNSFSAGDVSRANVIAGLVTLPISYWLGGLSDRLGRQRFLALSFLMAAAGASLLSGAAQLWHYWMVSILLMIAQGTNTSLASATTTDMVTPEALSRSLSKLHNMNWVAGIIGFAGSGYLFETFTPSTVFIAAAALSVLAVIISNLATGKRSPAPLSHAPESGTALPAATPANC